MPRSLPNHRPVRLPLLCAALAGGLLTAEPAHAEEAGPPHWQFYFTPYLWISGVTGTTTTRNPNIPAQTATASFGGLLSHLNSIPLVGASELRYGRFGLLVDLQVVSLRSGVATQGPAFSGATVRVTTLTATLLATYRVLEASNQALDLVMDHFADGRLLVFVPGSPRRMSGTLYVFTSERVQLLDVPLLPFMRSIAAWGLGPRDLIEAGERREPSAHAGGVAPMHAERGTNQ